jgi:heme exporter protein C
MMTSQRKTMSKALKIFHRLASPAYFFDVAGRLLPWVAAITALLLAIGTYAGLFLAPADYQQSDAFRIIYVHVPAAWMSMFIYLSMAFSALLVLVWRIRLAEIALLACIPIGAVFTFLALATGAIWGKPMWGAWWVWDARLTSELVLLFLYLGVYAVYSAFEDERLAAKAASILAVIGVINLPIIHFSVEWWHTLHQGATITKLDTPSIHPAMLWPLLVMAVGAQFAFLTALLLNMRTYLLRQDAHTSWVKRWVQQQTKE